MPRYSQRLAPRPLNSSLLCFASPEKVFYFSYLGAYVSHLRKIFAPLVAFRFNTIPTEHSWYRTTFFVTLFCGISSHIYVFTLYAVEVALHVSFSHWYEATQPYGENLQYNTLFNRGSRVCTHAQQKPSHTLTHAFKHQSNICTEALLPEGEAPHALKTNNSSAEHVKC